MKKKKKYFIVKMHLLILFSTGFKIYTATSQIVEEEEPKMYYYEMTHERIRKLKDMKNMRDVTHKDKFLMGKNRITGNISYNAGRVLIDDGHEVHQEIRSAIGFFTRIRFFEQFSLNTTFYKDFNPKAAARWTSNYTYSVARYNWKPNKLNFGYENYLNNRYSDNLETFGEKFLEGYYFVSYSHNLSDTLTHKIRLDNSTNLKFIYFVRYAIKYRNENEIIRGGVFSGKPTVGAGFRYTIFWNIYIESAVYFYFNPTIQKQPWDPDYSYGFGYFDWRCFRLSLTYGNWAVNRFPWNKTFYPHYGFFDGNFKLAVNWMW